MPNGSAVMPHVPQQINIGYPSKQNKPSKKQGTVIYAEKLVELLDVLATISSIMMVLLKA